MKNKLSAIGVPLVIIALIIWAFYPHARKEAPISTDSPSDTTHVGENLEGEADPARMTLGMNEWKWISATDKSGTTTKPAKAGVFVLTFGPEGRFSAKTDCNAMGGSYAAGKGAISLSQIFSTKMYCADSQESEFAALLGGAYAYHFTGRGELVFDIAGPTGGQAVFR